MKSTKNIQKTGPVKRGERAVVLDQDFMRSLPIPTREDGSRVYYDAEIPGFCCQVTYTGTRTFRFRYRRDGQWYSIKIGRWRDGREPDRGLPLTAKEKALRGVTAGMARKQAEALRTQVEKGENPGLRDALQRAEAAAAIKQHEIEREEQRRREAARVPLANAYAQYVEALKARRNPIKASSLVTMGSTYRAHILPALGRKPIAEVSADDVRALARAAATVRHVDGKKRGGPRAANRSVVLLRSLLNWSMKKGLVERNVISSMDLAEVMAPEVQRQRYLSPAEMSAVLRELDDYPYRAARGSRFGPTKHVRLEHPQLRALVSCEACRIALLTGARKGEVYRMKWSDVDLDVGWWHKPSENMKSGRAHEVALGTKAIESLRRLRAAHADPIWVFPGKKRLEMLERGQVPSAGEGRHVLNTSEIWRRIRSLIGLDDVRIHDLRHTHASVLISAGATLFDVGAQLGHTQAQTTMRYAHLMKERKQELARKFDAFAAALPEAT